MGSAEPGEGLDLEQLLERGRGLDQAVEGLDHALERRPGLGRARGFGCRTPVKLKDVGRWVPVKDRPARARELAARSSSEQSD